MGEISAITNSIIVQQFDIISAPANSIKPKLSVWAKERELLEAVAKYIPRNPDGSLDIEAAKKFTVIDLLERASSALAAMAAAQTPEERERLEKEYRAFDNLLQKREKEELDSDPYKDILNLHNTPPKHK